MSSEQIISLFQFDHYPVPHALGGPDEAWNLQPVMIQAHRQKTRETDVPEIARTKRISKKQEEFRQRLLAKDRGDEPPPSRWPKRKMRMH